MHPFKYMSLFAVGAIGAALATWVTLIRPGITRRTQLLADNDQKRAVLAGMNQSLASANDVDAKSLALKTALDNFEARITPARQAGKALEDIWRLAEGNSLQIRTIRTITEKRDGERVEQDIEMSFAGDFSGFYQFLLGFENARRLGRIRSMNLSRAPEGDGQIVAAMNVSLYFQPEAREEAALEAQ